MQEQHRRRAEGEKWQPGRRTSVTATQDGRQTSDVGVLGQAAAHHDAKPPRAVVPSRGRSTGDRGHYAVSAAQRSAFCALRSVWQFAPIPCPRPRAAPLWVAVCKALPCWLAGPVLPLLAVINIRVCAVQRLLFWRPPSVRRSRSRRLLELALRPPRRTLNAER